ncbi:hypothetical protein L3X38_038003 [Prunus dulcis]|uniref:Uncharacterized protein n=1 Tax=Prunus dulcis TaxID=3755 RepID=A0AAD4YR50_PRUDU|nr:hypothetical protein L3X38_038003 [Prunus dulcis]
MPITYQAHINPSHVVYRTCMRDCDVEGYEGPQGPQKLLDNGDFGLATWEHQSPSPLLRVLQCGSYTPGSHAKPSSTLIHQANFHAKPIHHQYTIFNYLSSCRKHQYKTRSRWKKNKVRPWDFLLSQDTLGLVLANSDKGATKSSFITLWRSTNQQSRDEPSDEKDPNINGDYAGD